jgi:hypothetical protein
VAGKGNREFFKHGSGKQSSMVQKLGWVVEKFVKAEWWKQFCKNSYDENMKC